MKFKLSKMLIASNVNKNMYHYANEMVDHPRVKNLAIYNRNFFMALLETI